MKPCPSDDDLQRLLGDLLSDEVRTVVEGHVETCASCQVQLDRITQADELQLVGSASPAKNTPAFLQRLQHEYPATLLQDEAALNGSIHFPGPATERAPLGTVISRGISASSVVSPSAPMANAWPPAAKTGRSRSGTSTSAAPR
jgi:hypothetical protein